MKKFLLVLDNRLCYLHYQNADYELFTDGVRWFMATPGEIWEITPNSQHDSVVDWQRINL